MELAVFLHGLWMPGFAMTWLRHGVERCGYRTRQFQYPTVRASVADNAQRLQTYLESLEADTVHFVAHSLGGLVVRQLFAQYPQQRPGRIVTLGTPHQGSDYARHLARYPAWRHLLGGSLQRGLLGEDLPPWTGGRDFGVIAGNRNVGTGMFLASLQQTGGDGVVSLAESHLPGETDYLTVAAVHTQLLLSREVRDQVCSFLKNGRFEPHLATPAL